MLKGSDPSSKFFLPVSLHKGNSYEFEYAPFVDQLPLNKNVGFRAFVLQEEERSNALGLYVQSGTRIRFAAPMTVTAKAIKENMHVDIYHDITQEVGLDEAAIVYANGGLVPGINTIGPGTNITYVVFSPYRGRGINPRGSWDAKNNIPVLSDNPMTGRLGDYWVVTEAGDTPLSGISDWEVGDLVINMGDHWIKSSDHSPVTSVAGKTGDVLLNVNDIKGSVKSVNGKSPDSSGNIEIETELDQYVTYSVSIPGEPESGTICFYQVLVNDLVFDSAVAKVQTPPTTDITFLVVVDNAQVGTVTFDEQGQATITLNLTNVAAGSTLSVLAPEAVSGAAIFSFAFTFLQPK